nr:NUDIX domain-containing protein [Leucobacter weissii]
MPPAVAVSSVAFALRPPVGALIGVVGADGVSFGRGERRASVDRLDRDRDASEAALWLPLVRRTRPPFEGDWALPGGPIPWDETLVDTALRTLRAAVRRDPGYLEQLYSFGAIERSAEAQRLVTIAYWALYGESQLDPDAGPERDEVDPNVAWFSADRLPSLAFDHTEIVAYALGRLRSKTEYSAVAHRFLGESFTLAQLREVREAILGEQVDPANFRRQALAQGTLVETGATQTGTRHRPARLYRFRHGAETSRISGPAVVPATAPSQNRRKTS